MKKFLLLALLLLMTSCDFGTESTKVLVRKSVVISDTNVSTTHTLNISGKISLRNSSGNDSGFSAAVVCLESSGKCVRPNSTGVYSFAPLKTSSLYGTRSLVQSDTTTTPEGISQNILPDTVVKIDSNIVYDTIIKNDTIYQIQTYHIVRNVYIDSDTTHNDSVIIYSNSRILYEIPVTSWKSILPNTWCAVKQFGVEGPIKSNEYSSEISSVEIIYWNDEDSIALNIGAGLYENKRAYSGTVFLVLDSNYQESNDYVVVRLRDSANNVFAVTKEFKFNKMFNVVDFGKAEDTLVPGGLIIVPTLQWQAAIKVGEKVNKIYVGNSGWYSLDSITARQMFDYSNVIDSATQWCEMWHTENILGF